MSGFVRRHQLAWDRDERAICGLIPAKPFTARSLPGMTQGARKRKAHAEASMEAAGEEITGTLARALAAIRAKYRIGERLRPCPGKHGCVNCTRTCGACEDLCLDDTWCLRCGAVMTTDGPFCDGSGVLPARKAKQ